MEQAPLPEWLMEPKEPLPAFRKGRFRARRRGVVERTINEFARIARDDFFAERTAGLTGLLQGIHPTAKLITTFLLIGTAAIIQNWPILLLLNLWVLLLAHLSAIPLNRFCRRVWLVVPLFTGVIVLPSIFNFIMPGTPLIVLHHFGHSWRWGSWTFPEALAITRQGSLGALGLLLRVGACVSLALLMTLTTRWPALLKAFRSLRVPQVFTAVLEMTYRYIYVLLVNVTDMFLARQSRMVGRASSKEERLFLAGAMGSLWNRAYNLSEEVHLAMLARGYTGEPRTMAVFKVQTLDWLWVGFTVLTSAFCLWGDKLFGA